MTQKPRKRPRGFGEVSKLPSGNYRARYVVRGERYSAPRTFPTAAAADAWLAKTHTAVSGGVWEHPDQVLEREAAEEAERVRRDVTFGEYAAKWIARHPNNRRTGKPLSPVTIRERERLCRAPGTRNIDDKGGPLAGLLPDKLADVTETRVRAWYSDQQASGKLTQTSRAYELLASIMGGALKDRLITENPCVVEGGTSQRTGIEIAPPASAEQFEKLLDAMSEKYKALLVIFGASGCRWGEAADLRADDITVERDDQGEVVYVAVRIDSQVVHVKGEFIERSPKSQARTVIVAGEDADIIARRVEGLTGRERLYTAVHSDHPLAQGTFWRHFNKARIAVGMPKTRVHDLRHYAGTRYAQGGATLKEIMARLGHSSPSAALRYQHDADEERRIELAARAGRQRR